MGKLKLNPGAQEAFVNGEEKYSAYIGGLGSGKTFAGIARGLKMALQPKPAGQFHAPRGVIAASSYPVLRDVIVPQLQEVMHITGLADWENDWKASTNDLTLKNGAVINLRSLDNPNWLRGPEYTWFYIDEGRNVGIDSWKVLTGRLRQKGYKRAGFVGSTPNGFDWMYDVFHPDGARHESEYAGAVWYNAATYENIHLDSDYMDSLTGGYSGRFFEQEVMGKFIGIVEGGVFPEWNPIQHLTPMEYNPKLPLYSFWDFGIGDPGICIFAQVEWKPEIVSRPNEFPVRTKKFPYLYILSSIEAKDWTAKEWAAAYHEALATTYHGAKTRGDYGDPAGIQRNPSTGSSVISDLNAASVPIVPVPKRPQDYAIRILQNMMNGDRVLVNPNGAKRVSDAFSSHKWAVKDGVRIGVNPVHDWTSHYVDAVRYGATMLLSFHPRENDPQEGDRPFEPTEWGYIFEALDERDNQDSWLGQTAAKAEWTPPTIRVRKR